LHYGNKEFKKKIIFFSFKHVPLKKTFILLFLSKEREKKKEGKQKTKPANVLLSASIK
jgi:hypothetical protein